MKIYQILLLAGRQAINKINYEVISLVIPSKNIANNIFVKLLGNQNIHACQTSPCKAFLIEDLGEKEYKT